MKRLIGMQMLLLLAGCGPEALNTQNSELLAHIDADSALESLASKCESGFSTTLKRENIKENSPKISFATIDKHGGKASKALKNPTTLERCQEVKTSFSIAPSDMAFEIDFAEAADHEKQMLMGKEVSMRPERAQLLFTDGSLNGQITDLTLRCPEDARVTCKPLEGGEHCASYEVAYVGKCTFVSQTLVYTFSDLKTGHLDVKGEIVFSGQGATIRFESMSWMSLN